MADFLVFQLKAPLASFGNAMGMYRSSDLRPRRGAVMGLLAAAIGIDRSESSRFNQLSTQLKMASLTLRQPTVLVDYHTVQGPAKRIGQTRREQLEAGEPNCMPTRREYLQDGHWLIALQGPVEELKRCAAALEFPRFPLYIGRRCCALSAYTSGEVHDVESVEAAIAAWMQSMASKPGMTVHGVPQVALYWDEGMNVRCAPQARHVRNDQRTSLAHNFFTSRVELEGSLCLSEIL